MLPASNVVGNVPPIIVMARPISNRAATVKTRGREGRDQNRLAFTAPPTIAVAPIRDEAPKG